MPVLPAVPSTISPPGLRSPRFSASRMMWRAARSFEQLNPAFVSVTYGAGGSTRDRTVRIVGQLAEETTLLPVAHLTAVGHSVAELRSLVGAFADRGITNLLALRGDLEGGVHNEWVRHPEGLEYAVELVEMIRGLGDFRVGVASFPEGHPRALDIEADTANLIAKLRAGAEYSITQMFFDTDGYLRLRDRVVAADPEQGAKPIIPGLMPITSLRTVRRQVELSGSQIPPALLERLVALGLGAADFEPEQALVDGTTPHAVERVLGVLADGCGLAMRESADLDRTAGRAAQLSGFSRQSGS